MCVYSSACVFLSDNVCEKMGFFLFVLQEEECHERDGWCLPGTSDQIRSILYQRTTELAERLKQEQLGDGTEASASQLELIGEEWAGHEGVQNYLQMLEQDDDIEAYDIFDDYGEGDD